MLIKTIKLKKPKILGIMLIILMIIAGVTVAVIGINHNKGKVYELKTENQRQEFLKEMGWQVSSEFDECKTAVIPEEWNEVYKNYNNLQKQQGFDLTAYKGKQIEIYTYSVKNYPDHEKDDNIICNLMIYQGQLIGGDICSTSLNGFMQGLVN